MVLVGLGVLEKSNKRKMIKADLYYINNLNEIIINGSFDENPRPRYKDGGLAISKFITQVFESYDISKKEFPITTLRNTAIKTGIKEIMWIYQDQNNSLKTAKERGINWWNDWDIGDGTIGQRYGATVSKYDLMNKLLLNLEKDPFSRRHIINLYQENDLSLTNGLYPCAFETIWSVRKVNGDYFLDMTLVQRSNDYIVSGYINKIQYTALLMMVASHVGYKPGVFCHLTQNLHIYDRHLEAAKEILERKPMENQPILKLKQFRKFYDFKIEDFEITQTEGIKPIISSLDLAI